MKPLGSVTVTRVRRCAEEAKGGLELAWSFGVASAFQRLCETSTSSFDAEVTGHTTPAVADVGRGSLRVRFSRSHVGDETSFPTGGLLLGVRRLNSRESPSSREDDLRSSTLFFRVDATRTSVEPRPRFLPAIAAAPGARGPDRHGASRDGLAELVVMARPLVTDRGDASKSKSKSSEKNAHSLMVTSLDDAALRAWLPVSARAEVVVVRRVTGFHLGLNANRWLKIRMREIADGVAGAVADARTREDFFAPLDADDASFFEPFYRGTGLVLDPSGAVHDAPAGASYEFEHWGAGGNTGVSGQVTDFFGPKKENESGVAYIHRRSDSFFSEKK